MVFSFLRLLVLLTLFSSTAFPSSSLWNTPWGKDQEITDSKKEKNSTNQTSPSSTLNTIGQKMIRFHQVVISPADGPRSHYKPCSSQYTLEAMKEYGFTWGVMLGCDRLMRENDDPWVYKEIDCGDDIVKSNPIPKIAISR